jgi:hypothetical protein
MVTVCVTAAADIRVGVTSLTGSFQRSGQTDKSLRRVAYAYEREAGRRNPNKSSHVPETQMEYARGH